MSWVKSYLVLSLALFSACGDNPRNTGEKDSDEEIRKTLQEQIDQAAVAPVNPNPQPDFSMFAYYPNDEKYQDTGGLVSDFLIKRSAELKKGKKTHNLLQGKTRSPINGEWNPSTDIWVCIELNPDQQASKLSLRANQELLIQDTVIDSWCWYKLGIRQWERLARPIQKKDIPNIYRADYLKQVDSLGLGVEEMFTVGEIIYLEAVHEKDTIHSYLRMRYGE